MLEQHVKDARKAGCRRVDECLGIQKMPPGYALMLDHDEMYFYWLRDDGVPSVIHWNKWAIWHGAKADAHSRANLPCGDDR